MPKLCGCIWRHKPSEWRWMRFAWQLQVLNKMMLQHIMLLVCCNIWKYLSVTSEDFVSGFHDIGRLSTRYCVTSTIIRLNQVCMTVIGYRAIQLIKLTNVHQYLKILIFNYEWRWIRFTLQSWIFNNLVLQLIVLKLCSNIWRH